MSWRTRDKLGLTLTVTLAAVFTGCATSPLGRTQLQLFSEEDMRAMGEAAFTEIRREKSEIESLQLDAYVQCVARAVTDIVDDRHTEWEIVVFDDADANAFALPGGKIGIYAGLLDVAETQDQLASVIGHEIGHVIAGHANERLSASALTDVGLQVAAVISGSASPQRDLALAALGLQVGVLLPFSRTQEEEADLIGLELMAQAGFHPEASIELWRNMARRGERAPPELLSTHPSSEGRIQALKAQMPAVRVLYERAVADGRRPDCDSTRPGDGT